MKIIRNIFVFIAFISICLLMYVFFRNAKIGDCHISVNGNNIEYYSECFNCFVPKKKYLNDAANAEYKINNVIGICDADEIKLSFEKKPFRVSLAEISDSGVELTKIKYSSDDNAFIFNPLYDNVECWISVVADYGIEKKVITFCVYNKEFLKIHEEDYTKFLNESKISHDNTSKTALLKVDYKNLPINSSAYSFEVFNNGDRNITVSDFIIEKKIDDKWYIVEENMNSFVAQNLYKDIKLADTVLSVGEKRIVKLDTSLFLLFDEGIGFANNSGEYRFAVPYSVDGEIRYAVSNSFTSGYVAEH